MTVLLFGFASAFPDYDMPLLIWAAIIAFVIDAFIADRLRR